MSEIDSQFRDLTDYIIKITEEIWESRNIDAIYRYYHKNVVMHTPYGVQKGVEPVVQSTLEFLHIFPDRRLLPQAVICSEQTGDYHSSHRIISTMHHTGDGIYGRPSQRLLQVYTIADCAVRDNQIYEEWLVRDYKALILQIGWQPLAFVREKLLPSLQSQLTKSKSTSKSTKAAGKSRQTRSTKQSSPIDAKAQTYVEGLTALWRDKKLAVINQLYHPACTLFLPGGVIGYGRQAADAFFLSYMASFSDRQFTIQRVTVNTRGVPSLSIAVRWILEGIHSGEGVFGAPTLAPVRILGISHAEIQQGQVVNEWIVIDELAILAQIEMLRHTL